MRTIWKGNISFGLVNIPVQVSGAVQANNVSFNMLHKDCKTRIRYQKYCPECEKDIQHEDIIKGYQTPDGVVTVTEEELEQIKLPSLRTVELAGFIKEIEVEKNYYQKPYYLLPDGRSDKAYWLLYHSLKKSRKAGIARFAVHSREHLALVRPIDKILTLSTLYYPEEIKPVQGISPGKPDLKEMDLALSLIDQQTVKFEPKEYTDRYKASLEEMLAKKKPEQHEDSRPAEITDLLDTLKKSIKEAEKNRESA